MPVHRGTPLSLSPAQKEFVRELFETPDGSRVPRTRGQNVKFNDGIAAARDAFLKDSLEQLSWVTDPDGIDSLNEKEHDTATSAASLITNILHFAGAAGVCPMEVLETALTGYNAQRGQDGEFRLVAEFVGELLDTAEGRA
ncbi:hypothetical protein [Rhizobium sp. MHM7A]|uniref:hypothetical protein n=1 Tax=Rhizobium sp. MHM7A TaxID=2583233 RepID=UPI0011073F03|nr:hypothetical protein [Rhizobium sp. MHM7A]TLX17134.1 hypothetical protein FFR93_07435 [Rhizobium sp. MHM7A]